MDELLPLIGKLLIFYDYLHLKAHILTDVQFTMVEPVFTSAGVASGIDLSLRIVSYFFGTEIGQATAHYMQYPYPANDLLRKN